MPDNNALKPTDGERLDNTTPPGHNSGVTRGQDVPVPTCPDCAQPVTACGCESRRMQK